MNKPLHAISTACYLREKDKLLFIRFDKKWRQVYAPPGGKIEKEETPLECVKREFYEETNLKLLNVKYKATLKWILDDRIGIIYLYTSNEYEGDIVDSTEEGKLEWINIDSVKDIKQFPINSKIPIGLLLDDNITFEGKFYLDENEDLTNYDIAIMK